MLAAAAVFQRLPSFFLYKTSGIFNLPFLFVLPVIFLSPELSCSPAESSSQLKTLAPHLYSPSPLSSRAGSEPPPSSPPSALPAPAPATSSLSPPPPPPPPPTSNASSQDASLSAESEEEKAKKLLYCSLCKVAVNSLSQLEAHNAGKELFLEESFRVFLMYNLSWQQQRPKLEICTVELLWSWHLWVLFFSPIFPYKSCLEMPRWAQKNLSASLKWRWLLSSQVQSTKQCWKPEAVQGRSRLTLALEPSWRTAVPPQRRAPASRTKPSTAKSAMSMSTPRSSLNR